MTLITLSAILFTVLTTIVILFQLCLVMGLPWGAAAMGGKFPGKFPPKMRIVAIFISMLLSFTIIIILARAELFFLQLFTFSKIAIWFVVVLYAIGTIMNIITPSKIEKIWIPVATIQLITSFIIAIS